MDHGTFISFMLSEVVDSTFRATKADYPLIAILPTTDCRSLYDAVRRSSTQFAERRTQIDVAAIKEASTDIRWVPTDKMVADGLTKRSLPLRNELRRFLNHPELALVEVPPEERPLSVDPET
jgi:hypothetical protein